MENLENIMSCGHKQRYLVSADEGTIYCMECAWEAEIKHSKACDTILNALDREEIKVAQRDGEIDQLRTDLAEAIQIITDAQKWNDEELANLKGGWDKDSDFDHVVTAFLARIGEKK